MSFAKYTSEIKQDTFNVEFIAGNIKLSLTESDNEFVIVPGKTITKDTKVTVEGMSEACFVFVKFNKSNEFDNFMEYEIASEWKELADNSDIYYCESPRTLVDKEIYIFKDNQIIVKETVTKDNYEELSEKITLDFTAYAVQKTSEITKATDAWEFINSNDNIS